MAEERIEKRRQCVCESAYLLRLANALKMFACHNNESNIVHAKGIFYDDSADECGGREKREKMGENFFP